MNSTHTFAFHSDVKESLEHDVIQVHSPNKSGNPMHFHKPSDIWRRSPCLAGSCAYAVRPLVKMSAFGELLVQTAWKHSHVELNDAAKIDKCLVRVLLADNCWVSWTTAELSQ